MNAARQKAKELWPIMQAFAEGKAIEWLDPKTGEWKIATAPTWSDDITYHIYEEPKLVPFTFEDRDLFKDKWFVFKDDKFRCKILGFDKKKIYFKSNNYSYQELLWLFTFEDGSPCGKYIKQ
jgi:hypothetical protein